MLDFDDTHLKTIIHPAGPVASALTAWAEVHPVSGADFMNALVIGCELECRIGNSVFPEHYAKGWHITGTTGVFGAAAAIGRLLKLDERHMTWAIGIAASQPVGLKVQFGSDTKSFHPGRAAQNGMLSALLAQQGFTASDRRDGRLRRLGPGDEHAPRLVADHRRASAPATSWRSTPTSRSPAASSATRRSTPRSSCATPTAWKPDTIRSIDLKVHPLVLNLMGKTDPRTGLEGKFSIYHAVAVAMVTGKAGEKAFTDAAVDDPTVVAVRKKVTAVVDPAIKPDQVDMSVTLNDGKVLHKFIAHAVGSQANPMTDAQLDAKFTDLCDGILSGDQTKRLMTLCRGAWDLRDAGDIARAGAVIKA